MGCGTSAESRDASHRVLPVLSVLPSSLPFIPEVLKEPVWNIKMFDGYVKSQWNISILFLISNLNKQRLIHLRFIGICTL